MRVLELMGDLLLDGEMEIEGRMPWSSNATFLVSIRDGERCQRAIYKPGKGERPLWDFPRGLYRREIAAYELAQWLGWNVVPRTIERDGDYGLGSVQQFVDARFEEHYFTLLETGRFHEQLKQMAVFDILANNADRKGGHCLVDDDDHLWGIDHGLCFHAEPKLRTVIWDFGGETVPRLLIPVIERLAAVSGPGDLGALADQLDEEEMEALIGRAQRLVKRPVFPEPRSGHPYPWPLV